MPFSTDRGFRLPISICRAGGARSTARREIRADPRPLTWKTLAALFAALAAATSLGCETGRTADSAPARQDGLVADAGAASSDAVLSLFGDTLQFPIFDDSTTAQLQNAARTAAARLESDPSAENFVWLGRRLAYLWRYERAIAVFTNGIRGFPNDAALYRHRGHRYITTRRFADAVADLTIAAGLISGTDDRIEEDGAPNPYNRPRSTLHFNVWYHLGLAHYLVADFERAAEGFRRALAVSKNDDSIVAASDWLYMSLRRSGLDNEAALLLDAITPNMEILENDSYHRRLLMYKGLLSPDELLDRTDASDLEIATQGYGVANWLLYTGDSAAARELLLRVVDGDYWPAFGYIAAEADLARSPE